MSDMTLGQARAIIDRHRSRFTSIPGVVSVGFRHSDKGSFLVIGVLSSKDKDNINLPKEVDGIKVLIEVNRIEALCETIDIASIL